jgi:hypothetical protein
MTHPPDTRPVPPNEDRLPDSQLKANIEFAWRGHAAQEHWTAKIDTKASIFFTINIAGLVAVLVSRTQTDGRLAQLGGWHQILTDIGILVCAIGVVVAGAAVFPLLGRVREHRTRRDIIYFGHLRHRDPSDVARQLINLTDDQQIDQLSFQLVTMAKGNWVKHRLLQAALLLALAGYGSIFMTVMFI